MTPKERAIIQQALEALESNLSETHPFAHDLEKAGAIRVLREALEQPVSQEPVAWVDLTDQYKWSVYCRHMPPSEDRKYIFDAGISAGIKAFKDKNIALQPVSQEPVAWMVFHNRAEPKLDVQFDEPDCIKSFESDVTWKKPLYAAPVEPVKQEPVAWANPHDLDRLVIDMKVRACGCPLYTVALYKHPVRTKDLTDDEIRKLWNDAELDITWFARAVIAADREKNK